LGKQENKVDAGHSSVVEGLARRDERSFKEALAVGDNIPKTLSPAEGFLEEISKAASNAFEIKVDEGRLEMLQNSFVGYLVDEKEAVRVPEGLLMEGYDDIQATFMGGNMMLLHSVNKGVIQEAVKMNGKWWKDGLGGLKNGVRRRCMIDGRCGFVAWEFHSMHGRIPCSVL
jgi:hypothetical protein